MAKQNTTFDPFGPFLKLTKEEKYAQFIKVWQTSRTGLEARDRLFMLGWREIGSSLLPSIDVNSDHHHKMIGMGYRPIKQACLYDSLDYKIVRSYYRRLVAKGIPLNNLKKGNKRGVKNISGLARLAMDYNLIK